ncbi:MAG: hypothetical protein UY40_C0010G0014 [candidate division CPR1 bacterium GW2011_GWC1_49_13]|uniref:GIY-YIG domain-containing protein n=1 Tax=candidate division CPR1 bacterium GW2011_GWC1_49_13 TaxID=1618342 RepID=A0A0G1XT18_9BACT|nr:MAG: hypothetical protein UY40_C0010G0014 [candidate division CPR1 bacterium GW2011_GWC1_49_13]
MIGNYKGHYSYDEKTIGDWKSSTIGVYYCGYPLSNGNLYVLYVGRAVGGDGIRGRLLQHLREEIWPDVSHFGYCVCAKVGEAEDHEAAEIARLKPSYNIQGK